MTCNHGIMAHVSEPKPEIAKSGSLRNAIVWRCTAPGCGCIARIHPDPVKPKVATGDSAA